MELDSIILHELAPLRLAGQSGNPGCRRVWLR
jgi:hypothetical protein